MWKMDKKVVVLHYSYKKHSTMKNIRIYALLALLMMVGGVTMQAQIRIDKQQCFGGYGDDIAYSIVEEEDFFLVAGLMEPSSIGTGHIQCDGNHQRTWVAKISL